MASRGAAGGETVLVGTAIGVLLLEEPILLAWAAAGFLLGAAWSWLRRRWRLRGDARAGGGGPRVWVVAVIASPAIILALAKGFVGAVLTTGLCFLLGMRVVGEPAPAETSPRAPLRAYIGSLVGHQPEPPRSYDPAVLRRLALRQHLYWVLLLVAYGVGMLWMAAALERRPSDPLWAVIGFSAIGPVCFLYAAALALLGYRRVRRAVEQGLFAVAQVEDFDAEGGLTPAVTVSCLVPHPRGAFRKRDTEMGWERLRWVDALEGGAPLEVLVHPDKREVLLWLGPREAAKPETEPG